MDILDIAGRTRTFGAPKDWNAERDGPCGGLPIRDEAYAPGVNRMVSEWKPNEIELEHLKLGAPLQLGVIGEVHPVVSLGVGAPPAPPAEGFEVKMSKIQRLMTVLERGPDTQGTEAGDEANEQVFRGARQLILALLGISAKPVGEQIAAALDARVRADCPDEPGDLDTSVKFARRWLPECLPAEDNGQVPFARALVESVLDAAEGHLKREVSAPPAPTPEAGERQVIAGKTWTGAPCPVPMDKVSAPTPEAGRDLAKLSERAAEVAAMCRRRSAVDDEISPVTLTQAAVILEKLVAALSFSPSPPPAEDLAGQGEPVAWMWECCDAGNIWAPRVTLRRPADHLWHRNIRPLYAAPAPSGPADREAVTAEEIAEALWLHDRPADGAAWAELVDNANRFPNVIGSKVQKYRSQARAVLALRDAPRDGGDEPKEDHR